MLYVKSLEKNLLVAILILCFKRFYEGYESKDFFLKAALFDNVFIDSFISSHDIFIAKSLFLFLADELSSGILQRVEDFNNKLDSVLENQKVQMSMPTSLDVGALDKRIENQTVSCIQHF